VSAAASPSAREPSTGLLPDPGHAAARIAELPVSEAQVRPDEPVREVAARFVSAPQLDAVAVVDGEGRPEGLLTRARLLSRLGRVCGYELYARKPVTRIADPDPLLLEEDTPLAAAVARGLARPGAAVYDAIVVVDGARRFRGLLEVRELVMYQSVALARSSAEQAAAVERSRDLERLDALRARFLAHATHELRSPVNAIAALAEILRLRAEAGDLAGIRERLGMLLGSAASLRATVNNILDLSAMEAGRVEVAAVPVDLGPLVDEVAATARLLAGGKPLEVSAWAPAGLRVQTDRLKLKQVLLNLASNAVKFTDRGRVELGADGEGDGARLWVADTGVGIRPEDLDRLFVPFGQLEEAISKAHEGTGLGLVIARSLAQLLGGRIEVESLHGTGSTFAVHLPAVPPRPGLAA
jgi:signal transduction histidine kinase